MIRRPPRSTRTDTLFPYTPLFRSQYILNRRLAAGAQQPRDRVEIGGPIGFADRLDHFDAGDRVIGTLRVAIVAKLDPRAPRQIDRVQPCVGDFGLRRRERDTGIEPVVAFHRSRSEELRVGEECVSTSNARWWRDL